jgi:sec-independent protein translocase protein TatC
MEPGKARKSPDEMTFLEHLEDLRKRLFYSFLALLVGFVPGWIFSKDLYRILARPVTQYLPEGTKLAFTTLTAPFMLYIKVAVLASVFLAAPVIFLQVWYFVAPGLYRKEKKYVVPFVLMTTFFFSVGAVFGYFVVFPWACRFFLQIGQDFQPVITVDQYFGLALKVLLGLALVFQLPTLVFFLAKMGVLTANWMIRNFKYAVLLVFVVAAVITPTPDVVTQSIVAVPMLVLYGLSILIAMAVGRGRDKKED